MSLPAEILTVAKVFYRVTKGERISSDDFRNMSLDKDIDHEHGIGGFFASLMKQDLIREVGRTRSKLPSNHGREIRVFRWSEKAEVILG